MKVRPNHLPGLRWLPLVAAALLGCQFDPIDLGSNGPDAGADAGFDAAPVVTSDCPAATEAELEALSGNLCGATCGMEGGPRASWRARSSSSR